MDSCHTSFEVLAEDQKVHPQVPNNESMLPGIREYRHGNSFMVELKRSFAFDPTCGTGSGPVVLAGFGSQVPRSSTATPLQAGLAVGLDAWTPQKPADEHLGRMRSSFRCDQRAGWAFRFPNPPSGHPADPPWRCKASHDGGGIYL